MKNSQKGSVSLIILIVVIIAAVIGIYYMGNQKMVRTEFIVASAITAIDDIEYSLPTSDQSPSTNEGTVDRMKISIMIPKDTIGYTNAMDKFTAEGGPYPAEGFAFVKQEVEVEYTDDLVWASANAAARTYAQSESGPYVAYLKVVDRTAYIVPTAELNAYEGQASAINKARPVITKTLLQFPEIDRVLFEMAPSDEANSQIINIQ